MSEENNLKTALDTEGGKFLADLEKIPEPQLTGHMWRQEGNLLICQSCTFNHSSFIKPGYQLYGIDKAGLPMIRKIIVKD